MRRHTCSRPARGGRVVNGGAWLEIDGSVVDRSTATFPRYAAGQRLASTDRVANAPTSDLVCFSEVPRRHRLGPLQATPALEAEATCRLSGPAAGAAAPTTTSPRRARRRDVVPPPRGPSPVSTEPIVVHPRRPATAAAAGAADNAQAECPETPVRVRTSPWSRAFADGLQAVRCGLGSRRRVTDVQSPGIL